MIACLKATSRHAADLRSSPGAVALRIQRVEVLFGDHGGDRADHRARCASAHSPIAMARRYSTRDDASLADALPRQAQHQGIELRTGQRQRARRVLGPDELAAVQAPRGQPHADAVMHEHLHAVGAAVGEQVGMVRPGRAEDVDHAGQRRLGAGAHVQRLDGQPHGSTRITAAARASRPRSPPQPTLGQVIVIAVAPRRSSIWMSLAGAGAQRRGQAPLARTRWRARDCRAAPRVPVAASGARRWR